MGSQPRSSTDATHSAAKGQHASFLRGKIRRRTTASSAAAAAAATESHGATAATPSESAAAAEFGI